jgi:hypothetical protein
MWSDDASDGMSFRGALVAVLSTTPIGAWGVASMNGCGGGGRLAVSNGRGGGGRLTVSNGCGGGGRLTVSNGVSACIDGCTEERLRWLK